MLPERTLYSRINTIKKSLSKQICDKKSLSCYRTDYKASTLQIFGNVVKSEDRWGDKSAGSL